MARLGWMDGLRGIAALQVVLLHVLSVFLPAIGTLTPDAAHYSWEAYFIHTPLSILFDGYSSVYLFFILSGAALTYPFSARPVAVPSSMLRRLIRLGLPMAASILLAATLIGVFGPSFVPAEKLTKSGDWLIYAALQSVSLTEILHEIFLENILTGFADLGFMPSGIMNRMGIVPHGTTYNGPLWTLHIEFVGSLVIALFVALRSLTSRHVHLAVALIFALAFAASPLVLFVVGHLAADSLHNVDASRPRIGFGLVMLIGGFLLCSINNAEPARLVLSVLPRPPLGPLLGTTNMRRMLGAILIF